MNNQQLAIKSLLPTYVDRFTAKSAPHVGLSMGAGADSYYEYLLKLWLQSGKHDKDLKDRWVAAVNEALGTGVGGGESLLEKIGGGGEEAALVMIDGNGRKLLLQEE